MAYEHLSWASKTDMGRKRKNNEDNHICLPQSGIFCVADGMGGMSAGEVASGIIVETIKENFETEARPMSASEKSRKAIAALTVANERIHEAARARGLQTVGSTVVVAAFDGKNPARLTIVHAGDSRCYRFRDGELLQLTTDHSVAQAVGVDEKKLSAMFRGVVTRAIGTVDVIEPERTNIQTKAADVYLICSDGLTRMIPDSAITEILTKHSGEPLLKRAETLINAANEAGGDDNVTTVLIEVKQWDEEAVKAAGHDADEPPSSAGATITGADGEERDTEDGITPVSQAAIPVGDLSKRLNSSGSAVPSNTSSPMTQTLGPGLAKDGAAHGESGKSSGSKTIPIVIGALILIAGVVAFLVFGNRLKAGGKGGTQNPDAGTNKIVQPVAPPIPLAKPEFRLTDGGRSFEIVVKGQATVEPIEDGAWDVVKTYQSAFDEWCNANPSETTKNAAQWIALWDEFSEAQTATQRAAAFSRRLQMLQQIASVLPRTTVATPNPIPDEPRAMCRTYAALHGVVVAGLVQFREKNAEAFSFPSPEDRLRLREVESRCGVKLKPEVAKRVEYLADEARHLRVLPLQNAEIRSLVWHESQVETFVKAVQNWQILALGATRAAATELRDSIGIPEIPDRAGRKVSRAELLGSLSESSVSWIAAIRSAVATSTDPISIVDFSDSFIEQLQRKDATPAQSIQCYRAYLYCVSRAWTLKRDLGEGKDK
jgi:protein phosphatase